MSNDFVDAIVACLAFPDEPLAEMRHIVQRVLSDRLPENKGDLLPPPPSCEDLEKLRAKIDDVFAGYDKIALVYGGATKIKGYVFESPKLPEIRGASALLDWVNEEALVDLWVRNLAPVLGSEERARDCIIYASGGNILAFAPVSKGQELASEIEHLYTRHTLTANSVAVWETFSLLELRYGRLRPRPGMQAFYWVEDFLEDCTPDEKWAVLKEYYYPPENVAPDDRDSVALRRRFFNRKTFGELVTVLATMFNRRRDELAYAGEPRSVPFYPMLPWAQKCDSSDIRPAVWRGRIGDEIAPREMSEASARKRAVGQQVKREHPDTTRWFAETFTAWKAPQSIVSWEQAWYTYVQKHPNSRYAQAMAQRGLELSDIRPPQDVGEIGQASSPGRYIGAIYADGNNVGRLIATLTTPEKYYTTSIILRDAARNAVLHALAHHLVPVRVRSDQGAVRWTHPFEILAIGGDDLFLIVPGSVAFDVALTIGYTFESELARELPGLDRAVSSDRFEQRYSTKALLQTTPYTPSIGLSAGVIIAQENAPIFFLRDLVEELLKQAKNRAKQHVKKDYYGGAIDFMVLKSITMVTDNIKAFRKAALGDQGDESLRRLTARPYTWHEFAGLLQTIRALKQAHVPRSQLYRLRRVLDADTEAGVITSVMEYLYTRSRLRRTLAETLMTHIEHNWCYAPSFNNGRKGMPPWLPLGENSGWETIWPDLLEAYEMVPEEQQEQP